MSSLQLLTLVLLVSTVAIPVVTCRQWCMAMPGTSDEQLQANIDFGCSNGVDCTPIQPGGTCYDPNTLFDHASYVMNAYYQSHGRIEDACSRQWCMAMPTATNEQLQANIDFACSQNVDCTPIQPGGTCYEPNTLFDHASFVMNAYYQSHGRTEDACRFDRTGCFVFIDPSNGSCVYYT
ncbi:X8 domain [Arabidopsis thaliana x Arabidopsis arenosa]|uniref:X8 domain n=1 Tax=Arabidopsis thaliana x Arabidopsis arenosa TaxID=1240361 RepID=A0A8T1XW50_9BRAS|nr:X8 domain [Arabidopsis thaliana x Arabidopsis arenosa]